MAGCGEVGYGCGVVENVELTLVAKPVVSMSYRAYGQNPIKPI